MTQPPDSIPDPTPESTPNPNAGSTPVTPTGILIIDKPEGWTSMDVCAKVRVLVRRAGGPKRSKVGHAGTLDPFATGVLVVLVGKATRQCDRFMAGVKEYVTTIDLARRSDTQDPEGRIETVKVATPPDRAALDRAVAQLTGVIMQRPPAHSAIHIDGQRAYKIARRGEEVDIPARPVHVHQFEVLSYTWPLVTARIRCAKGTYIRSLARDLGDLLHTGGMLTTLRRTQVGEFSIAQARSLDSLGDQLVQADLMPIPALPGDPESSF